MAVMSKTIVLLTFLYFIQGKIDDLGPTYKFTYGSIYLLIFFSKQYVFFLGLPYGFQASFLPMYLRMQGVSLTNLSLFKVLLAPWLCKALWAPLVDKKATKQKWLLWSVSGLVFICAFASLSSPTNLFVLSFIVFFLNFFAATQDIAVDGIAVALLTSEELGKGNTAQVVGYKIGSIFGGGVLVWFMDSLGWSGLFLVLALLYIEALLFIYLSPTLRNLHFDSEYSESNSEDIECSTECQKYTNVAEGECDNYGALLEEETGDDKSEYDANVDKTVCKNESFDSSDSNRSDSFEIVDSEQIHNVEKSTQNDGTSEDAKCTDTESKGSQSEETQTSSDVKHRKIDHSDSKQGNEPSIVSGDNTIEMEEEEELEDDVNEFEPIDLVSRWTSRLLGGKFEFIHEVVCVPGTLWMLIYVAIYKLGKTFSLCVQN